MAVRAAVLREPGTPVTVEEIELAPVGPNEVRIRTAAAGVCHSDLHFVDGLYTCELPCVPGHESAGVVEEVGTSVTYVAPGDHVITCMSAWCGACPSCAGGRPYMCESDRLVRGANEPPRLHRSGEGLTQLYDLGSYAEEMLVHERTVVKVRDDMPLDRAALIGCAVMTGFGAVTNTAAVEVGSTVAVIGCGGIGLSAINGAVVAGAGRVIAVDIHASKLAMAARFGATDTVDASTGDPVATVRDLTGGGVDYAFEAVGTKTTAEQAYEMARDGGTALIIGMVPEGVKIEIDARPLQFEKRLTGSNMGSNRFRSDMPRLVDLYLGGRLRLDEMISARRPLDEINEAFDAMKAGEVARTVLVF